MPNNKPIKPEKPDKAKEKGRKDKLTKAEKDAWKAKRGKNIPAKVKTREELVDWRVTDLGSTA